MKKQNDESSVPESGERLLRLNEIKRRTGLSRSSLWRLEQQGLFPRRCRISTKAVGWAESQVDAFIRRRLGEKK